MNNNTEVSFPILRKFNSLSEAIATLEAEGKLDLSYNRELAVRDAKYTDHRSKPTVIELEAGLHLIVRAPDGLLCVTQYSPFSGCLHDGDLGVTLPTKLVDGKIARCEIDSAEYLTRFAYVKNSPDSRAVLAKGGVLAWS